VQSLGGIGSGPLYISAIQHESYFKSDEEGSEGAAATGISGTRFCVLDKPKPVDFVAERPFLELIMHKPTNSILFLNRIVDPR